MQIETEGFIEKFAAEFICRFRRHSKVQETAMPSTRQAIAIAKLLSARYMKKRKLTDTDFIEVAVVTAPPKVQKIAEEVAEETLSKMPRRKIVL